MSHVSYTLFLNTAGPPHLWVPDTWLQPTADGKYFGGKKSRKFQKAELEFAVHRQLFTQPLMILGIVSNLEMTKYTGGCA